MGVWSRNLQFVGEQREEQSLIEWVESQRPINTTRTYDRYTKEFLNYAKSRKLNPQNPVTLASFMKYCATERPSRLGQSVICNTIPSAVAGLFRYKDEPSPAQARIVQEVRKTIKKASKNPLGRSPLTMEMLEKITNPTNPSLKDVRDICMVVLMTCAMLRESEAVQLGSQDVWEEKEKGRTVVYVFVQRSKTDQTGEGCTICLDEAKTGSMCPVKWFRKFSAIRNKKAKFFFHAVGKKSNLDQPLADQTPNFVIKTLLKKIGVDPTGFGSHSCRKGGCTMAIEKGADKDLVARHGRWASPAMMLYVKDSVDRRLSVTKSFLSTNTE
jgi:site-specific recombinase XerD